MPDSPQPGLPSAGEAGTLSKPAAAGASNGRTPQAGDRYVLGCTATVVDRVDCGLVVWHVDRGTAKPLEFAAPPAEFARHMEKTLAAGATFQPAGSPNPSAPLAAPKPLSEGGSVPSAGNSHA